MQMICYQYAVMRSVKFLYFIILISQLIKLKYFITPKKNHSFYMYPRMFSSSRCPAMNICRHHLLCHSTGDIVQKPINMYTENQAALNIIEQNKISNHFRHLDIPVTFSHEKLDQRYFTLVHIDTKMNVTDRSTKAISVPILQCHWDFRCSYRSYPSFEPHYGHYITNSDLATKPISMNNLF